MVHAVHPGLAGVAILIAIASASPAPAHIADEAGAEAPGGTNGPEMFEIALWANAQGVEGLPGLVSIRDHPCGAVATVRLNVMPPYQEDLDAAVGTERVAELDRHGQAVTRWSVPVDYRPVAIAAAELLIEHSGQRLWIDPAGNIRRGAAAHAYPPMLPVPCPADGPLARSEHARCGAFADLVSGERREIEYEGPCT
jgi:hypothetical protein